MTKPELYELLWKVANLTDADAAIVGGASVGMARKCARTALGVMVGAPDPTAIDWRKVGDRAQASSN